MNRPNAYDTADSGDTKTILRNMAAGKRSIPHTGYRPDRIDP